MVTIKLNLKQVVGNLQQKIAKLNDKEYLMRPVAQDAVVSVAKRIHIDGVASDGNQIGLYSKGYLAVRSGLFKTNDKFKSGPRKGQTKPTGVFTKGAQKGQQRPQYQRGTDPKVIISLTRQLENNWSVIATQKGYGIGFTNPHNFDKSQWVQATYDKRIFDLTETENQNAQDLINKLVADALK